MSGRCVKYGRADTPTTVGAPSGTREEHLVSTPPGSTAPAVLSLWKVARASFRTLALSGSGRAVALYTAWGEAGKVRAAKHSKSIASSMKETYPFPGIKTSSLTHRIRSSRKSESHRHS